MHRDLSSITGRGSAKLFWMVFGVFLLINLPFIVCDLLYGTDAGITCVTTPGTNIQLTLGTWLQVDGYCRLAIVSLLLISAIIGSVNGEKGMKAFMCAMCFVFLYSIFQFSWIIVGSVLFWGDLNNQDVCEGTPVQAYMFALLIISFVAIVFQCGSSYKTKQST